MVNIKDYPDDVKNFKQEEFKLEAIFYRQRELLEKYREIEVKNLPHVVPEKIPVEINSYLGQDQIKHRLRNCIEEICEATDCLKNKSHKVTMVETDVDHFGEEVADALHYFVEACILAGITASDLFSLYMRKSEVNKFRQRSNY